MIFLNYVHKLSKFLLLDRFESGFTILFGLRVDLWAYIWTLLWGRSWILGISFREAWRLIQRQSITWNLLHIFKMLPFQQWWQSGSILENRSRASAREYRWSLYCSSCVTLPQVLPPLCWIQFQGNSVLIKATESISHHQKQQPQKLWHHTCDREDSQSHDEE